MAKVVIKRGFDFCIGPPYKVEFAGQNFSLNLNEKRDLSVNPGKYVLSISFWKRFKTEETIVVDESREDIVINIRQILPQWIYILSLLLVVLELVLVLNDVIPSIVLSTTVLAIFVISACRDLFRKNKFFHISINRG